METEDWKTRGLYILFARNISKLLSVKYDSQKLLKVFICFSFKYLKNRI